MYIQIRCMEQKKITDNLRSLIREASSKTYSHILLMGDFNYPNIDWNNWRTKSENTE